ncbi:MAG: hypothetical protein IT546_07525 [Caulobacteraceae bacterium]|nr:hypothetical protein [Caulobacteraceae bacterium]
MDHEADDLADDWQAEDDEPVSRPTQAGLFRPLVGQVEEARSQIALAELMAACRKMTDEELPRIARLVRATDRVHALRRLAEASTSFYLAVETAAFRLGLERRDRTKEEGPRAGRWAW